MSVSTPVSKKKSFKGPMLSSLAALYDRRWLALYFVRGQVTERYRGSFLGLAWLMLSPLLMIVLYTAVFSKIIGLRFKPDADSVNFGLYLYCGLIPFTVFSETVNKALTSVKNNSSLVQKVVFPLEILPLASVTTSFVNSLFGLGVLIVVLAVLETQLHWTLLLLPLIMVPQMLFVFGLGCLSSVAGAYVPDARETIRTLLRAMFFVTPIIWPPERVPERLSFIVDYNPLAYLVESYRALILESRFPDVISTVWFSLFSAGLAFVGLALFVRAKKRFADLA